MIYRKYESGDISAIRDILENDLGYNCELDSLKNRVDKMMKRGNYQIFVACDGDKVVGYVGCVNYLAFELENEETLKEAETKKNVLVIGGGVAGMEAAYVAYKRGHKVVLCEASDKLGGQIHVAAVPISKQELTKIVKYLALD